MFISKNSARQQRRLASIDGLRAIAVFVVIVSHMFPRIVPNGIVGVDIFFSISGFLITRSLLLDMDYRCSGWLRAFYLKRFWRLIPASWTMVLLVSITSIVLHRPILLDVLASITSTMNWLRATGLSDGGWLGHTWTLSVEEQFYLIWPIVLLVLRKLVPKRIGTLLIIAAAIEVIWRSFIAFEGAPVTRLYNGLDTHSDGLMLGCALAFSRTRLTVLASKTWIIPTISLSAIVFFSYPATPILITITYCWVAFMSTWLLAAAIESSGILGIVLNNTFMTWGGTRSYSLYLWHFPIWSFISTIEPRFIVKVTIALALTPLFAEVSYRLIERPLQIWAAARWFGQRGINSGLAPTGFASQPT